jgi:hypothetical protein
VIGPAVNALAPVTGPLPVANAPVRDRELVIGLALVPATGLLPTHVQAAGQASAVTLTSTIDRTLPTMSATIGAAAIAMRSPMTGGPADPIGTINVGTTSDPGDGIRLVIGGVR